MLYYLLVLVLRKLWRISCERNVATILNQPEIQNSPDLLKGMRHLENLDYEMFYEDIQVSGTEQQKKDLNGAVRSTHSRKWMTILELASQVHSQGLIPGSSVELFKTKLQVSSLL